MKENDKTSHRAELMRDIVAMVNQNPVLKQAWQRKKEKSIQNTEFEYPEHLSVEHIDMGLFKMEYLTWNGSENPYVILQLHGGGYMSGLQGQYRKMAGLYAEISSGAAVLSVDYRLAPEYPFPAALEDAVAAYKWLRDKGYESDRIIVVGDSAGGGLALALCLYAKDHGLPLPAGIITMSPWTDVSLSGASYEENYTIDPLFGNSKENMLYQCSYIGNANPKNPYLSPLFGDFEGFPPMLMQVGAYEVLLDDTRAAAKKARAEGVKVRCSVYDGMFHVFQMGLDLIPESREAWEEVAEYLRIIYRIHREPEGTVVKKVKTRRKETEDRARLNLLAFLKRELKK